MLRLPDLVKLLGHRGDESIDEEEDTSEEEDEHRRGHRPHLHVHFGAAEVALAVHREHDEFRAELADGREGVVGGELAVEGAGRRVVIRHLLVVVEDEEAAEEGGDHDEEDLHHREQRGGEALEHD